MTDCIVLCYHAVDPAWPGELSVHPENLERQLTTLLRRGYRAVTFSDAMASPPPYDAMVVTFDDGYRSIYDHAFPLLRRLGIPATVFVPTSFVGSEKPMSWPGIDQWAAFGHGGALRCMGWDQLRELADAGWEIASHTRTHPLLSLLDDDAMAEELVVSREECERGVGGACRSIAYPYGDVDGRVIEAARSAGYDCAAGLPAVPCAAMTFDWPRVGVYQTTGHLRFRLKVSPLVRRLRLGLVQS